MMFDAYAYACQCVLTQPYSYSPLLHVDRPIIGCGDCALNARPQSRYRRPVRSQQLAENIAEERKEAGGEINSPTAPLVNSFAPGMAQNAWVSNAHRKPEN